MAGSLPRARAALASLDFRRVLAARLTSQLADGVFQAFLVNQLVFLSPEGQSTTAGVARASILLILPFSLVGPFTGVVIDRWPRRSILAGAPALRALCSLALVPVAAGGGSTGVAIYSLALLVLALNRFYLATAGAVMPALVPDEDLLVGNALAGTSGTIATFVGLLGGTQVAGAVGNPGLLVATALLWPLSAALAWRLRTPLRPIAAPDALGADVRRVAADLVAGARRLAATPAALGSILTMAWDQFLFGALTVLSVVVFRDEFSQGVASYGRIIGAGGVGLVVGAATVGLFQGRLEKQRIVALSCLVAGAACLLGAIHVAAPAILLVGLALGLTYPWRKVPVDTIVQESIPDRFRGRVFALYDLAFAIPRVLAALTAIVLVPVLSTEALLALIGAAYLAWAPLLPWWVRRPRWVRIVFHAGGRADEVPRAVVVGGEEEPVEVLGSWHEELLVGGGTVRRRRFRLRSAGGDVLEVSGSDGEARWRLLREVPASGPPTRER